MIKHRKAIRETPCSGSCEGVISKGDMYFRQTAYEPPKTYCEKCFATGTSDYLMWVGAKFYKTIKAFVDEADRLGVCKRVPKVPSDISPGVSRVFLVHDEGKTPTQEEREQGIRSCGRVFGFFPIMAVRLVLDDPEAVEKYRDRLTHIPLEILGVQEAMAMEERECGHLTGGAVYLISPPSMLDAWEAAKGLADWMELRGGIIVFKNLIEVSHLPRFRGIKHMEPGLVPPLDDLGISLGRFQIETRSRAVVTRA